MLKLNVHPFGSRKSLIFVNTIEKCYKLKLFLEQFGIRSCALNAELPVKSRHHIVQEFNRGKYNFIIATDESSDSAVYNDLDSDQEQPDKQESQKKDKKVKKDDEYGVSRGIDFKNVQAVINFDLPKSSKAYQHRIGRTARGFKSKGYALSFIGETVNDNVIYTSRKKMMNAMALKRAPVKPDEAILGKITKRQEVNGAKIEEFSFDMKPVEAFRYRCQDALRAVTGAAVRQARLKEIKSEMLVSDKLQAHFQENPGDLQALRHDNPVFESKVQPHLKNVPSYLLPRKRIETTKGNVKSSTFVTVDKRAKKSFKKKQSESAKVL
jgi:ATP-dependent RNA helicase DDX56/DBP9